MRHFSPCFLRPRLALQRQYEALRAFYVDREPAKRVAERFGYTIAAFNSLRRDFARDPQVTRFFREVAGKPWSKKVGKIGALRGKIVEMRKRFWSVYDIAAELGRQGRRAHPSGIFRILRSEGFGRLPRRLEVERRQRARRGEGR